MLLLFGYFFKNSLCETETLPGFCYEKSQAFTRLNLLKPLPFLLQYPSKSLIYNYKLRRVRDSNPRRCNPQQFSRLPQSTTLPTLRRKNKCAGVISKINFKNIISFLQNPPFLLLKQGCLNLPA